MNKGFLKTGFAGVAVLLTILVVFAGLFAVFTLYEREIDSALQNFESAVLDNENAAPNEIVAEAAGTAAGTLKNQYLTPGTSSYSISLNASYNGQSYGYLARIWDTSTDHTTSDCIYSDTTWDFGDSARHQYDDCASVALHIDLGPYAAELAKRGIATLKFSGDATKSGDLDNFAFSIQSSTTAFNLSPTGRTLHEAARDGGSNFLVSGQYTSAQTFNKSGALAGRYLRIIFSAYDDDGFFGGPFGWINITNMSLTLSVSDSTAPTIGTINNSNGQIEVSDSGTGVWKWQLTGTSLNGNLPSGEQVFVSGSTTTSTSIDLDTCANKPGYGVYTLTVWDGNGGTAQKSFTYYNATLTYTIYTYDANGILMNNSSGGTATIEKTSGLTHNDTTTITAKANTGYYFAGIRYKTDGSSYGSVSDDAAINSSNTAITYTVPLQRGTSGTSAVEQEIEVYFVAFSVSFKNGGNDITSVPYSGTVYTASATAPDYFEDPSHKPYITSPDLSTITYKGGSRKYAGTYTATATAKYEGYTLGTSSEASLTITPKTVYVAPVFSEIAREYNGTTAFTITSWNVYNDSARKTLLSKVNAFSSDLLVVNSANKTYNTTSAIEGTYTFSANGENINKYEFSTVSNAESDDANAIANSYTVDTGAITSFAPSATEAATNTTLSINSKSVGITIFIAEKTQDGTVQKYAGKVYDGTNAIGNVTKIFTYNGTDEDALTQFGNANPAKGELGIGIYVTNLVTDETYAFAYNGMTAGASNADLTVTLGALPYYSNPNYNNGNAVSASLADDAVSFNTSNYYYSASNLTLPSMTIYQRSVTVVVEAKDKTYDGTVTAEYKYSIEGAVADEDVTLNTSGVTAEFGSADAGTGKTVTVTGYELASKWSNNYYILNAKEATTTASIWKKTGVSWEVRYTGRVKDPEDGSQVFGKVYDGTTTVDTGNLTFTIEGAVNNEGLTVVIPTYIAVYSSANACKDGITVDITVTGTKFSSNYEFENESFTINGLTIVRKDISSDDFTFTFELTETEFIYSAAAQAPGIETATDDGKALVRDSDYEANIPNSVDVGDYWVTISGIVNYSGEVKLKYSIAKGDFNINLNAEAEITLPYGVALDINSVGEAENAAYFSGAYAYTVNGGSNTVNGGSNTVNGGSRIEGGAWEFVIGDIYNKSGNTSLYRAGKHNIEIKYTLPESVAANYDVTEKTVGVALHVEQGKLSITILTEQMTFGTPYSLGAVRDVDYTIEGFVAGDDGNLTGVAFELIDGTDNGFVAANDTLNAVGTYEGVIKLSASYSSYNKNYTVEYTRGDVVISKLPVTVTPNEGQSKYYGESDPVFTYTATKTAALKAGYTINYNEFSGEVTRNGGETAGTYAYVNELTSTNYDITFERGNSVFEIYKLPVTVVPVNYSAYYGEAIPAPSEYHAVIDTKAFDVTYRLENGVLTVSGMENELSITFNTLASQNASAGEYSITITQATADGGNGAENLYITSEQGTYTINRLPVTITPNSVSKTYGSNDPSVTNYTWAVTEGYDITLRAGFNPSFSGSIVRETGENVGTYAWSQGTLYSDVNYNDYNGNYDISFNGASGNAFTITPRGIMIDAVRLSITVGDPTPAELGRYTLNANSSLYDASWTYSPKPTLQEALQGGLVISKPDYNDDGTLKVKRDENGTVVGYDLVPDETLASYYLPNGVTEAGYTNNYYISAIVGATGAMYVGQLVAYISYNGPAAFVFGSSVGDINDEIKRAFTAVDNTAAANTVDIGEISGDIAISFSEGTYPEVGYAATTTYNPPRAASPTLSR